MSAPDSSARILQAATTAPLLASQKSQGKAVEPAAYVEPLASQKRESTARIKADSLASQKRGGKAVNVKATKGDGQKSKTIKVNGLTFRVRLSDQGFRVMLLTVEEGRQHEPYLVSLRRNEWEAVKGDKAAFVAKVMEKLRQRLAKASDGERGKLQLLLATIEAA